MNKPPRSPHLLATGLLGMVALHEITDPGLHIDAELPRDAALEQTVGASSALSSGQVTPEFQRPFRRPIALDGAWRPIGRMRGWPPHRPFGEP